MSRSGKSNSNLSNELKGLNGEQNEKLYASKVVTTVNDKSKEAEVTEFAKLIERLSVSWGTELDDTLLGVARYQDMFKQMSFNRDECLRQWQVYIAMLAKENLAGATGLQNAAIVTGLSLACGISQKGFGKGGSSKVQRYFTESLKGGAKKMQAAFERSLKLVGGVKKASGFSAICVANMAGHLWSAKAFGATLYRNQASTALSCYSGDNEFVPKCTEASENFLREMNGYSPTFCTVGAACKHWLDLNALRNDDTTDKVFKLMIISLCMHFYTYVAQTIVFDSNSSIQSKEDLKRLKSGKFVGKVGEFLRFRTQEMLMDGEMVNEDKFQKVIYESSFKKMLAWRNNVNLGQTLKCALEKVVAMFESKKFSVRGSSKEFNVNDDVIEELFFGDDFAKLPMFPNESTRFNNTDFEVKWTLAGDITALDVTLT